MTDFNITLDVRDSSSPVDSSYTNSGDYHFKYIGGSDSHGGVTEIVGSGTSKITVSVNNHPRYQITDCKFDDDVNNDLSYEISADKSSIVITDTDVDELDGYYKVLVTDTSSANALVSCDPPIKNRTSNN